MYIIVKPVQKIYLSVFYTSALLNNLIFGGRKKSNKLILYVQCLEKICILYIYRYIDIVFLIQERIARFFDVILILFYHRISNVNNCQFIYNKINIEMISIEFQLNVKLCSTAIIFSAYYT